MIEPLSATHGRRPVGWRPCVALSRLMALAVATAALSSAASTLTEQLVVSCGQDSPLTLQCSYRLLEGSELQAAVAQWHGQTINATLIARYPEPDDSTALLVLVDTSDPARAPALRAAITHIDALIAAAPAHFRIGLASFDTDLHMLAPLGAERAALHAAAAQLEATGRTTELYRNVRDALRVLAKSDATRKTLWVLSDGLAEDYAYHHADVIALARANDIIIDSIGYPRSVAQSVALQTLRRLSDDSGGHYLQTHYPDFKLPVEALPHALSLLDDGGRLGFDLAPLVAKGAAGALDLSLALQTLDQRLPVLVAVVLPAAKASGAVAAAAAPTAIATPRGAAVAPGAIDLNAGQVWPWLSIVMALLVAILTAVLVLYLRVRRGPPATRAATAKPLAWLLLAEAPYTRYSIDRTPWRIGRGRNNDFSLDDHSVSRLHAEVRSNQHGGLTLHDLASLNGVFVNDTRIESVQLRDGDVVDIGDVRLGFTLHDESHAGQEATVMVRTRSPA